MFTYPSNIRHFTHVLFATEPGAGEFQWTAGFVVLPKNQSCDIVVFRADGAVDYRSDCWHMDDPRCKTNPEMYRQFGRGVFKLAPDEATDRRLADEVAILRREMRDVKEDIRRVMSGGENRGRIGGQEMLPQIQMPDQEPIRRGGRPRKETVVEATQ